MIDLLSKPSGTVVITDAIGNNHSLPSFPQLQKDVSDLVNDLTGAVAQTRTLVSQAANFASDAQHAADAAAASAASIVGDAASAASAASVATRRAAEASASATSASGSATASKTSETSASSSASAASASKDSAGFSAEAAKTYKDSAESSMNLADQFANAAVNIQVTPGHYSAFHWAEQARLTAIGAVIYRGSWDASLGTLPSSPKLGDFYFISKGGTVGGMSYVSGDMAVYDGTAWDRIDNQQLVTSVAGKIGAVTLSLSDIGGLQSALGAKASTDAPVFTGPVVISNNSFRLSGWNGVATDGVLYFGSGDSYLYKTGGNFSFVNAQGSWNATLSSGGNIWTTANFNPATKLDARSSLSVTGTIITDWNSADTNGWYMASNASNAPSTGWYFGRVTKHNDDWIQQELWDFTAPAESVRYRRHKSGGTWGAWTGRLRFSGDGNPGVAEYNTALTVSGSYGGGIGLVDSGSQGRIWMTGDGWLHMGTGSPGQGVTERIAISAAGVKIMGGPNLNNEGGIFRVDGAIRSYNRSQTLAANGTAWVEYPRVYVQGGDPGGQAQDGDLWIW
ncbi:hypothetical protein ISN75_14170 [Dyella marensis]|uniref:pyocin knob domain-containing protein n=1 Tax=Dyella marensis TaxID=500610 RepID=UPI0031DD7E86